MWCLLQCSGRAANPPRHASCPSSATLLARAQPYRTAEAVNFAISIGGALDVLGAATNLTVEAVAGLLSNPVAAVGYNGTAAAEAAGCVSGACRLLRCAVAARRHHLWALPSQPLFMKALPQGRDC